jgi:type IX secretion system substrate protein/pregnancy-associated plasma protein-A/CARDB protein
MASVLCFYSNAQDQPLKTMNATQEKVARKTLQRCSTMETLEKLIQKDPTLPEKWRLEGERQYKLYLQRQPQISMRAQRTQNTTIVVPIVFHLVDDASSLVGISDRDVIEQVEILNRDYGGNKIDEYMNVVPPEIAARIGKVPIKFVLARRDPNGSLTSGIERRVNATPDHESIKSFAAGGLDPWDTSKYLNVWCGTFHGADSSLLGMSTFPFTTGLGPQGVVINISTLPYSGNSTRNYFSEYSEGATLSHEIGHYFYLWHTFGDDASCNNNDFQIQPGWPLPAGAGPEGDDTPLAKGTGSSSFVYGNPSMNYKDGCAPESFGMMYGSFMNYFDDRALFMFSDGMKKRVEGCINLYRPGLLTTDGAAPPSAVNDAFLVNVSPRGLRERRAFFVNNTPLSATIRNNGTAALTSVNVSVAVDASASTTTNFAINLSPDTDTTISLGFISSTPGAHTLAIYTSSPNGAADDFLNNDTLYSFINIDTATATLPLAEDFSSATFPPAGWQTWNPNGDPANTWTRDGASGYANAGSAYFDNYNIDEVGSLDDLITPAIDFGTASDVQLNFKVAHAVIDTVNVSTWDGLEVYVSGDGGRTYQLVYKKTGKHLAIAGATTTAFSAPPSQPGKWRDETIDLSPYLVFGQKLIVKFRNTNAFGNNLYLDDVNIAAACPTCTRDIQVLYVNKPRGAECANNITPNATIKNKGVEIITGFTIAYSIDNGPIQTTNITGINLARGDTLSVNLPSASGFSAGQHQITVYTYNPVSSVGTGDLLTANDTLSKAFGIAGTLAAPLVEGFESSTFPPAGWVVVNPDGATTWARINVGKNSTASAYVNNHNYPLPGRVDDLYSPQVTYSGVDSISLSFDVAAAGFTHATPSDTLQVLVTKDCGNNFISVYKKWGANLQTIGTIPPGEFIPSSASQWRTETIDLTSIAPTGPMQFVFRNTNNNENNIFVDNVKLTPRILPGRLKREGLLVFPNPFRNQFTVWHYQAPKDLTYIKVYSSTGQLVWYQQFNGTASKQEVIDLTAQSAGVYVVKLGYADGSHDVAIKVVKY